MIKIVVVGWRAGHYINKCLQSINNQIEKNWECCVVLDPSNDNTYQFAKEYTSDKIKVIQNTERKYAICNIVTSINTMNPQDEDIITIVDADDWLFGNDSLGIMHSYYINRPTTLCTHGSWQGYPNPNLKTNNGPYQKWEFDQGIRRATLGSWKGSHLKSFKYKVFKHINQNRDFKDRNGNWLKSSYDLSLMPPALEMAGFGRVQYIPDILYVYNRQTNFNDDKVDPCMQDNCTNYLVSLPPYTRLESF